VAVGPRSGDGVRGPHRPLLLAGLGCHLVGAGVGGANVGWVGALAAGSTAGAESLHQILESVVRWPPLLPDRRRK
jgi:hypothetical protein